MNILGIKKGVWPSPHNFTPSPKGGEMEKWEKLHLHETNNNNIIRIIRIIIIITNNFALSGGVRWEGKQTNSPTSDCSAYLSD